MSAIDDSSQPLGEEALPLRAYPCLILQGPPDVLEVATPLLFENGCLGTEDSSSSVRRVYFPPEMTATSLDTLIRDLSTAFPELSIERPPRTPDRDWLALWKRDWHAFPLGDRFLVVPSWETSPPTERVVLRIDPERAFGTGTHETTRLAVELLEVHARPGSSMIDAGAGTGILAMVAACLGCRPVLAFESDPDAATCARANVRRNGLEDTIHVVTSAVEDAHPAPAWLVAANLSLAALKCLADRLGRWCVPGGRLVLSGLLTGETECLRSVLPARLTLEEERRAGEWAALLLRRRD